MHHLDTKNDCKLKENQKSEIQTENIFLQQFLVDSHCFDIVKSGHDLAAKAGFKTYLRLVTMPEPQAASQADHLVHSLTSQGA